MIRRTLLIAWQEFVKYVTRRGFLISLLMVPAILALSIGMSSFTANHARTNVMTVVDLEGGYAGAIEQAVVRENARRELSALATYAHANVDRMVLRRKAPDLDRLFEAPDRIAAIKAFAAGGGWQPVFARLSPLLRAGAPVFTPPRPDLVLVPPPEDLVRDFAQDRGDAAYAYLSGGAAVTALGRPNRLNTIVVIPKGFAPGAGVEAKYWSIDSDQSVDLVRWALTDAFRLKLNQALVPPEVRSKVTLDVDAGVKMIDPTAGRETSWKDRVAQLVPMGLAFLLFMVAFSDAALLLQGVVEEKSTRMIEVLLSCASPSEIMTGKLIGVVGLALVTILGWGVIGLAMAAGFSSEALAVIGVGLKSILPMLPLILVYFLCGLMIYAAIFLGIGATTTSLPDAQALIGPASMIIFLPNMLIGALVQDPNGTLAQVLSWIPIYTPFFMLVRLPFHPAPIELWATAGLTLLTTVLLVRQMGRVFARHVLTTERPPSFVGLIRQVFGRAKV
ncbi:ABC transporter permease [Rhizomicrobium electricum]|uniref:ABC-2 type transporter transmembrane domain-containing protein n=1 Tax=Rhizomicrobium electricum TaxID=480070 RepID=A0ABN1EVL9_9PROT|nr:ABC transporter permease [Rhizomicrobium electricum]NIJ49510.1 ABC-2 type transport system permease protein [Rhizomicrobium electricum]